MFSSNYRFRLVFHFLRSYQKSPGILHRDVKWYSCLCQRRMNTSFRHSLHSGIPYGNYNSFTKAPSAELLLSSITEAEYEAVSQETLDSLAEKFDELADGDMASADFDVKFANGVVQVNLGSNLGTYIINKQTPNKQIWLSSPTSGPKRYDFIDGVWIYRRDGVCLHNLLTTEISEALKHDIDFTQCLFGKKKS